MKIRILLILILSVFSLPSWGALESLVQEFQKTKNKYEKSEVQQRKLLGSLFGINKSIKKVVQEKSVLDSEKLVVDASVKELASRVLQLEKKSKEQKSHLRERLSVIYKLGGSGMARVLFSSSSSAELERNLKILGAVAKSDIQLIKDYTKSQKELSQRRLRFARRWEKLKKIEAKIARKEEKLLAQNNEKMQILDEVKKTQKAALNKLSQIRKKSRNLASLDDEGVLDLLFQASLQKKKVSYQNPFWAL